MKLAVAVAGDQAPPSAFVVWRGFEASIGKAADFGYHGIELALKEAGEVDPLSLNRELSRRNVEVSCISTGQVFAVSNLYFTHPDPERRKEVIQVFSDLVDLACDYGKIINVGRVRGFIAEDQDWDQTEALFIRTLEDICEAAESKGVTIIVEPVNRYEINFINSVEEGAAVLAKVKHRNVGLMPDVFHMNIEDDKIGDTLARNAGMVKYIHFADSNRLAPGQGHLDFDDVFDGLARGGFDGWSSVEILPQPDPDTAARQAANFLLPRIEAYNRGKSA
jgi:sugar phosphate isomerase/epimerase